MEHLRRHGLSDAVRSAFRSGWGGDVIVLNHLGGQEVARIEDALADSRDREDSPEREVWAPKPLFDPILLAAALAAETVSVEYGVNVETVRDDARGPVCIARDEAGGDLEVHARYVVACDGANGRVRRGLGIERVGPPPLSIRIPSVYFRSKKVAERVPRGGVQYSLLGTPDGPTKTPVGAGMMIAVDGDALWRLHGIGLDANDEAVTLGRLRALGAEDAEVLAMAEWTPDQGLATAYRKGAVFLAGDAAKVATPFGGLSVNVGMSDAFDLAWKFEATLRGWGGPKLLDESYDFERRRAGKTLLEYQQVDFTTDPPTCARPMPVYDAPDESLWELGPKGDAARSAYGAGWVASRGDEYDKPLVDLGTRYDGSPIVWDDHSPAPDGSSARIYTPTAKPGGRAPHVWLADGRSTIDLFGAGFTLLRTSSTVDASSFERAAMERGLPLRVEFVPEAISACAASLVLVRPDGYVAWRGEATSAEAADVLDRVRGC